MKSPYIINIKSAFLNQAITWPGVCGAEKTLNDTKIKGIKMQLMPVGLLCTAKDKLGNQSSIIVERTAICNTIVGPDEVLE